MSEYCVCCGEEIPEGRMVCPLCAAKAEWEEIPPPPSQMTEMSIVL